jgi:hypothetical protein
MDRQVGRGTGTPNLVAWCKSDFGFGNHNTSTNARTR